MSHPNPATLCVQQGETSESSCSNFRFRDFRAFNAEDTMLAHGPFIPQALNPKP